MYKQYKLYEGGPLCKEIVVEQLNEYYRTGVNVIFSNEVFGAMISESKRGEEEGLELFSNIAKKQ